MELKVKQKVINGKNVMGIINENQNIENVGSNQRVLNLSL